MTRLTFTASSLLALSLAIGATAAAAQQSAAPATRQISVEPAAVAEPGPADGAAAELAFPILTAPPQASAAAAPAPARLAVAVVPTPLVKPAAEQALPVSPRAELRQRVAAPAYGFPTRISGRGHASEHCPSASR
jgi:hypothetical protein